MSYDQEHVEYDEHDFPVSVNCVVCHAVIARRTIIESNGKSGFSLVRAPNYTEVYTELSDGSSMYVPVCKDCAKEPLDPSKAMDVVKRTWEAEIRHKGRPESAVEVQRGRVAELEITRSETPNAS